MYLKEETIFTSKELIIDADCKKDDLIVLLKGNGGNIVQLNGKTILNIKSGHHMIRFTKEHFCLLHNKKLSFYTLMGEFVSEFDIGTHIHELFPYKQGVLCSYGDQGVYGKGPGKNILNYISPLHTPESYYDFAVQNNLSDDSLFARYKPYACISYVTNELILLNEQLEKHKTIKVPFNIGNIFTFALTYKDGLFIEENKLYVWDFKTTKHVAEYYKEFSYNVRAIFHRHEFLFIEISNYKIQFFTPILVNLA